jgi:hypothetical protein
MRKIARKMQKVNVMIALVEARAFTLRGALWQAKAGAFAYDGPGRRTLNADRRTPNAANTLCAGYHQSYLPLRRVRFVVCKDRLCITTTVFLELLRQLASNANRTGRIGPAKHFQ